MDNKKLSEKKQELMKPDWTENLHHELQELPLQEAKWIVENMTDSEIFSKALIPQHYNLTLFISS